MHRSSPDNAKEHLAVFDVDGTLFRRGLLPASTRRLVTEGIFPERVSEELSEDYYAWVERRGSYENYDTGGQAVFLRELESVPVDELRRCAKAEVEARERRLHIYTRELTRRLKKTGYRLLAISGSPEEILGTFLKPLSFDRFHSTILERDDGNRYSGESNSRTPHRHKAGSGRVLGRDAPWARRLRWGRGHPLRHRFPRDGRDACSL